MRFINRGACFFNTAYEKPVCRVLKSSTLFSWLRGSYDNPGNVCFNFHTLNLKEQFAQGKMWRAIRNIPFVKTMSDCDIGGNCLVT